MCAVATSSPVSAQLSSRFPVPSIGCGRPAGLPTPCCTRSSHPAPVCFASTDPAQPYGAALDWPESPGRPSRTAGAVVILRSGVPLGVVRPAFVAPRHLPGVGRRRLGRGVGHLGERRPPAVHRGPQGQWRSRSIAKAPKQWRCSPPDLPTATEGSFCAAFERRRSFRGCTYVSATERNGRPDEAKPSDDVGCGRRDEPGGMQQRLEVSRNDHVVGGHDDQSRVDADSR